MQEVINNIRFGSLNNQGKGLNKNSNDIIKTFKMLKLDFLFLQDCGAIPLNFKKFSNAGLMVKATEKSKRGHTLAVIIKKEVWPFVQFKKSSKEQTQIVEFYSKPYVCFVNVYAHNESEEDNLQWENFFKSFNQENLIPLGDFNTYPNPEMDRVSTYRTNSDRKNDKLYKIMNKVGFTDMFRYLYPERLMYTRWGFVNRNNKEKRVGTRIDHIFSSKKLLKYFQLVHIKEDELINSDHRVILGEICLNDVHWA